MGVRSVLLVDDDATQLKLSRVRLTAAGFRVATAVDGDDALDQARRIRPDVILSDVVMGEIDGFALCRKVRADPDLAATPVILLSAHYRGDDDAELAKRMGASALVYRTADFGAEMEALRRVLADAPAVAGDAPDAAAYEAHLRRNASQLTRFLGQARSAEARYRALFENTSDVIAVLTTDGIILELNGRWAEVLGIPIEDMIGRHIHDFVAPGREMINVEDYRAMVARGRGRIDDVPFVRRDGELIYMEFSNTVMTLDGRTVVAVIGHEVTDKAQSARALAAAEEKYRTLVERIPDVVWTANATGKATFITANVLGLCGFTAEEVYAGDLDAWLARVHPDDAARVRDAQTALHGGHVLFDIEYRWRRKDG